MDLTMLLDLIRQGESERVEFKREPGKNLQREIAAFANADGGHILIGVDDSRAVVGTDPGKAREALASAVQSIVPPPAITTASFTLDGKEVFVIGVGKGERLCSVGGVVYIRIGGAIRPLSIQEVLMMASELGTIHWDEAPFESTRLVKWEYLDWFFTRLGETRGRSIAGKDRERYLRSARAVLKGRLTNAGVLFFTDATEHIPHAKIRLIAMERNAPQWSKEYGGPVWQAIEDAYADLLRDMKKVEVVVGARRTRLEEYPPRAVREAIINAVAHRNYAIAGDIRIFIHPDRLVIRNPGGLLPGVNLEDPEHIPRNPSLCNLLYDAGYIERYGLGIRMIREAVEEHPMCSVAFNTTPNRFEVAFRKEVGTRVDETDTRILNAITGARKSGEIARELDIAKPTILRRLKKLQELGLVLKSGTGSHIRYKAR